MYEDTITQVEDLKQRIEIVRVKEALRMKYVVVFGSPAGQEVLQDLLDRAEIHKSAFTGETNSTNFNLGRQDFMLGILRFMEQEPRYNFLQKVGIKIQTIWERNKTRKQEQ